jgi:DNA-binding YbaB/EbfC family protein
LVRKLKSKTGGSGNILKQAQEMQARMIAVQEELKSKSVEASVGGGAVLVKVNGQKEVLEVKLSDEIIKEAQEDKSMLEDLVLTAVTEAMRQAEELAEKEMGAVTGGINIPGLI